MAFLDCSFSVCFFPTIQMGEDDTDETDEDGHLRGLYTSSRTSILICTDFKNLFPSECFDLVPLQPGSFHVIPHVNQSIEAQVITMHTISAVQYYALRCTASQQQRSSRESHTYINACITHGPKNAAMRSTRIPRHRTPDPTTKSNQCTACHKRQAG